MKIVAISDTHRKYEQLGTLPEGDILIFAGDDDWTSYTNFLTFLNWFAAQPVEHKVMIAGNHDFFAATSELFIREECKKRGVHYLRDSGITILDITIWGSPYTPQFGNWAFMKERGDEILKTWQKIPDYTDILVTHGPPMDILDVTPRGENVGCWDLGFIVKKIKPILHIYGHIHGCSGVYKTPHTTYVNASVTDELYSIENEPKELLL
jgi:Icc-related predicted phosphoesterase